LNRDFSWLDITHWKKIQKISAYDLLVRNSEFSITKFKLWIAEIESLDWEAQQELETNIKRWGYIRRQEQIANKMKEYENKLLPENIDYDQVPNLSLEEKEKLKKSRPTTLAQAGRISGVNPTGLNILLSLALNNR